MTEQTAFFSAWLALTTKMLEAAKAHNFDQLSELADAYALFLDEHRSPQAADPADAPLLQEILDNQAQIAELATPWMDRVKELLRETRTERDVVNAYRQGL